MTNSVRLSIAELDDLAFRLLRSNGAAEPHARAVADVVVAAECDECVSHGAYRLPGYVRAMRGGHVDPVAIPTLTDGLPGVVRVDARRGFAPLALRLGRLPLAERARQNGLAALAVARCYHFSALWTDIEPLIGEGMAAFACTIGQRRVAAAGGTKPLLGTNPIAFGWPRKGRPPFVFDFATSVVARGEIELRQMRGEPIPPGWALDRSGEPTLDAAQALAGALLPFGGHKGAALSIMVELLAGSLAGGETGSESEPEDDGGQGPRLGGELVIAIDVERFASESSGALERAELLFAELEREEGARLPSSRRYIARERSRREGVLLPRQLHDELLGLLDRA